MSKREYCPWKVRRTRPRFVGWSVVAEFVVDTEVLDRDSLAMVAENAGLLVGVGDYRPRFGRYDVELVWS